MILPSSQMLARKNPSDALRLMLEQMGQGRTYAALIQKQEYWHALVQAAMSQGLEGLTMTTEEGNRWAVITADPCIKGCFRYTLFDRRGFFGHGAYATAEDAVEAAFDMGYRFVDRKTRLDEISALHWRPCH